MRKLFFLLMLVTGMVTAQPNASNTQTIGKYLKLSKVPIGLDTDNVLVRGSDNIVRYVPRSGFGGGSVASTIEQVLNEGNEITNNKEIIWDNTDSGYTYASQDGFSLIRSGRGTYMMDQVVHIPDVLSDSSIDLKGYGIDFLTPNGVSPKLLKFNFPTNRGNGYLGTFAMLDDIKTGTTEPASSSDIGTVGEIRSASGYIYWCIATNTWIRAAGSTF